MRKSQIAQKDRTRNCYDKCKFYKKIVQKQTPGYSVKKKKLFFFQ